MDQQGPALDEVFERIGERHQEYLDRLMAYLRLPSDSASGEGIEASCAHVTQVLRDIGLETRTIETAGWPMVYAEYCRSPDLPTVLLYGHYDVSPVDPIDEWISPPYEPTIRDGRLYARGVGDNKGQHFAQILAIEALINSAGELPCNVKIVLEGEEETGSPHMDQFAREHAELLSADLVITSDGPVHPDGASTIVFGSRGTLTFELQAHGANRDFHSGKGAGVIPEPIWTLVHLLGTMMDPEGNILIDGFYDDVQPRSEAELQAWANVPFDSTAFKESLGLSRFAAPQDRDYFERISAWPALTINGFSGGYTGPGSKGVIPHRASVKGGFRLIEAQRSDDIFQKLVAHVHRHAPEVEVVRLGSFEPSKTPLDSPWVAPIRDGIRTAQGTEPLLIPNHPGSLPNYVFTKTLGLPAFVVPYANHDERNHAPNENMEIDRFFAGIRTGAAILAAIGAYARDNETVTAG